MCFIIRTDGLISNGMKIKKYSYLIVTLIALASLATITPVFAQTTTVNQPNNGAWSGRMRGNRGIMKPAVFGTVSAISGNILTVAGKKGTGTSAVTTTYTVDATNAKIMKSGTTGTITSIIVGDTIMAQGTLTGTNLVATTIRDGVMHGKGPGTSLGQTDQGLPGIIGNGEPVIAGTISAISGSTLTVTNKSNVVYTVDVTNAKIAQGLNTITISNLATGDMVVIQGTVNGNSITASTVIDQTKPANTTTGSGQPHKGFFGAIGSFFGRIFGF